MARNKRKGLNAAAWFYSQSFVSSANREEPEPVQPQAAAHTHEIEPLGDETEWSDSDTTREMYASINPPR